LLPARADIVELIGGLSLLSIFTGVMLVVDHAYGVPLALHMLIIGGPTQVLFTTLARRRRRRQRRDRLRPWSLDEP
jgi:hypothetical protein